MYQSTKQIEIAGVDLLTWIFGNDTYDEHKPLFIDAECDSRSVSHKEAKSFVRKLIAGFKAKGLRRGDSVSLNSFNDIYYPLIYLAVVGAGGCFVGSNPAYTTHELVHLYKISEAKLVIVEPELLEKCLPAIEEVGLDSSSILIFNTGDRTCPAEFESWETLLEHGEDDWINFDNVERSKTTTVALMSTSGTTGLPKAAEISHYAHVSQSAISFDSKDKPYEIKRLLCLPQFHAFNSPLSILAPLREGHTTYIMRRYNPTLFPKYIEKYGITETTMVNPIIYKLLAMPEADQHALSSLRLIWCGGVPLDASVQNKFNEILHREARVYQVWGMTEVFWITSLHYPERDETGSAGRLLPNMEARIIDEEGHDLEGDGVKGDILVRGPSMMKAYLKNPEATKRAIIDGWLSTGDIGYQREGKWYIVDRAKDMLKVRGFQVSPTELEACLLTHPAIIDAAVIGVDFKDERGELPRAYIVLDPAMAGSVSDDEIHEYLVGKLSSYKALAGGIYRENTIPRSIAGKILKKVLRELSKSEIEAREEELGVVTVVESEISNAPSDDGVMVVEEIVQKIVNDAVQDISKTVCMSVSELELEPDTVEGNL